MTGTGYYVGTLDSRRRRVRSGGLLARGNGTWTVDDTGLSYLRKLTRKPIVILGRSVQSVRLSKSSWWAGRWLPGARVVDVEWVRDDGSVVNSGFIFAREPEVNAEIARLLTP